MVPHQEKVFPTTKISSSVHFDRLDVVHLKDHSYDVKKFNEWFEDKYSKIVRDEGSDDYSKFYLRIIFMIHATAKNEDFVA